MEKEAEGNYPEQENQTQNNFTPLEYSLEQQQIMGMADYMPTHHPHQHHDHHRHLPPEGLSFAEVMNFADFGPKLGVNQPREGVEGFLGQRLEVSAGKSKRKRPRSSKTTEEVEIQRMTHIAVERNRRKQMNEHLRVLRALMPSSYVQRGDQASIIGGAIEFVRELEQLLQCLESQKRRRTAGGDAAKPAAEAQPTLPPFFSAGEQMKALDFEAAACGGAAGEEAAEIKSCVADVEVKLLGFDAMIKILSRRRPGQLLRTIAAMEDLQLTILHTNITTIEQTVLYSFNVKITGEVRFSAEEIASSIQQIFSFINAGAL